MIIQMKLVVHNHHNLHLTQHGRTSCHAESSRLVNVQKKTRCLKKGKEAVVESEYTQRVFGLPYRSEEEHQRKRRPLYPTISYNSFLLTTMRSYSQLAMIQTPLIQTSPLSCYS